MILISFIVRRLLTEHYHKYPESYNIQDRSAVKQMGISVPKIFGADKWIIKAVKPEHQQKTL